MIFSDHVGPTEPGVFNARDALLTGGDLYMHIVDLKSYLEAEQRLLQLYADPDAWLARLP